MGSRSLLVGAALLLAALLIPTETASVAVARASCPEIDRNLGLCSGVDGGSVVLSGQASEEGQQGNSGNPNGGADNSPPPNIQDPACVRPQPNRPASCYQADEPGEPGIPTITIRDIATFVPTPGRQQMEPDGWAVAGLDTNFYAITGSHVVSGTLLGRPAEVRFTPTSYRWAYGDGTSAVKNTKGATWAALGIAEFERTPTSHVYERVGDYTITLSIVFAAEYRFDGGPWRPVVGTITLPANDLHIRVGTAKTVLVEHDCRADPSGPGC
jgi:hypothetical protein